MSSTMKHVAGAVSNAGAKLPVQRPGDYCSEGGKWSNIPIPPPRPKVMGHIRELIFVTGDQSIPLYFRDATTVGGFRLPGFGASIFGTACHPPLLSEEAMNYRNLTEDHVLVVRLDEQASHGCQFTVDILLAHARLWLLRYRLWQHPSDRDFWLVPTQGEGRSFRISHGLLALSPRAPFFCPYERNHGFDMAAESLDARRGRY